MLSELDQRLKALEYTCRRPVEHLLAGAYRSVFRGRGIEFEDVMPYQPGDDVRTMDWRVTARTGTPHIKRYIEEREQFFYLILDVSASMRHGSQQRKLKTVSEVCALLTMSAIENQDRAGLVLFSDRIEQVIPAAKGRRHAMRIIDEVLHYEPKHRQTNFVESLSAFGHIARKHSVVFVISDFHSESTSHALQNLAVKHDVNAIHIVDHFAETSALSGLVRMEDSESGQQRVVDLKHAGQNSAKFTKELEHEMLEAGVSLLNLEVGSNAVEALAEFFHARQRKTVDETGG